MHIIVMCLISNQHFVLWIITACVHMFVWMCKHNIICYHFLYNSMKTIIIRRCSYCKNANEMKSLLSENITIKLISVITQKAYINHTVVCYLLIN